MSTGYRIRVDGHLSQHWSTWFDGFELTHERDGTTTLSGAVCDQSQLHGLLTRVRDLGIALLAVEVTMPEIASSEIAAPEITVPEITAPDVIAPDVIADAPAGPPAVRQDRRPAGTSRRPSGGTAAAGTAASAPTT